MLLPHMTMAAGVAPTLSQPLVSHRCSLARPWDRQLTPPTARFASKPWQTGGVSMGSDQDATPRRQGPLGLGGVNHLALVSSDMARTVDFYTGVLGMDLVKTIDLPFGLGQHFFFDCGGGDCLAFFWFPDAPDGVPGISGPGARPDQGSLTSAISSMNHVAFDVAPERLEECRDRLIAAGVECTEIANHDDSELGISEELHPGVFVRSVYFFDPDGILLELAAWTRPFQRGEAAAAPKTAADRLGT